MTTFEVAAVDLLIAQGESMDDVERYIDSLLHLNDEQRSALFLIASIKCGRDARRQAISILEQVLQPTG